MATAGIICEYNPFHNGHVHHIAHTKHNFGCDAVVCLMSGNYVQRGSVAMMDKWTRASHALKGGADLVLELPTQYALCSAEGFAHHSVSILNHTGVIDILSFGSECGEISSLSRLAAICKEDVFLTKVMAAQKNGANFPTARQQVLSQYGEEWEPIIQEPNNILGLEYLKALQSTNSNILPKTLKRHLSGHHQTSPTQNFACASYLRAHQREDISTFVPSYVNDAFCNNAPTNETLKQAILYRLTTLSFKELAEIKDVCEGLENRIKSMVPTASSVENLLALLKTKRYPHTRLSRILLCALLGVTKELYESPAYYIRVLGFNKKGAALLKRMKTTATCPVLVKPSHYTSMPQREQALFLRECTYTQIYNLANNSHFNELTQSPIVFME